MLADLLRLPRGADRWLSRSDGASDPHRIRLYARPVCAYPKPGPIIVSLERDYVNPAELLTCATDEVLQQIASLPGVREGLPGENPCGWDDSNAFSVICSNDTAPNTARVTNM